ncbi:MAG TPA: tetratricopeptide repeat protein [Pirellulales bacterium]
MSVAALLREWRSWLPGAALIALVAVAYAPAFSAGWVLDDEAYVTNNPQLRSASGLGQIWLHPLAQSSLPDRYALLYTMFWVEYHLWGTSAIGFHAVNIALHAGCCVLLWRVFKRLTVPGGWLAAAIFAVHPVGVESVAWVTEGKNTLSMLFALASVLCYLRFEAVEDTANLRGKPPAEPEAAGVASIGMSNWRRRRCYVLSLAFFAAALLSKTQIVGLPIVLVAIYWWKRGRVDWRIIKPLLPFVALSAMFAALTVYIETQLNGASGEAYSLSIAARLIVAAQAIWFYVGKLAWPHPLAFIYPRWMVDTAGWLPYVFLFAAIQAVIALWLARNRIGRGPLAAVLIFGALLLPILGVINVCFYRFSYVADHFQYHAMAVMIALFAATVATFWNRLSTRGFRFAMNPVTIKFFAAGLLATLMTLSWKQSEFYAGPESLYADTLAKNPDCWMAHNNLANVLKDRGELNAAIDHYREALRIKPDYAEAHLDLGVALAVTGHTNDAIAEFQEAIRLKPNFAAAYNSLGSAKMKQGYFDEAIKNYEQAVRLNPNIAEAQFNLGALQLAAGKTAAAIDHFKAAIKLDPDFAEAHGNLGAALATLGQTNLAIVEYRTAVRLRPDYVQAQYNLGVALLETGQCAEALPAYQAALKANPNDLQCCIDLANVYAQMHRNAEALKAAEDAGKIARSTGKTADAARIEAWVASLRGATASIR